MKTGKDIEVRTWHQDQVEYRVIETSIVTDSEIERTVNEQARKGWSFDSIHFSMWEGSKRPSMAFLFFVRPWEPS